MDVFFKKLETSKEELTVQIYEIFDNLGGSSKYRKFMLHSILNKTLEVFEID